MKGFRKIKYYCKFSLFILLYLFQLVFTNDLFAQDSVMYEEILISIDVRGMGITEIPALITEDDVYLPVAELFDYLKIKATTSTQLDSVTGFFINQEVPYVVDKTNNKISIGDKTLQIDEGSLVKTETGLYLRLNYYGEIFGLEGKFNFRALMVDIISKTELPAVREARLAFMRNNINKLKGELPADTVIPRKFRMLQVGAAEWSVIGTQYFLEKGNNYMETRLGIGLGGTLLGGETNVFLNHNIGGDFDEKRQYYLWKYVNNNNRFLKQTSVGKIATQTITSLYAPVVGATITNTPTTVRKAFGTYVFSNVTQPGWIVELYVNNVLVDYTKADASGFYAFDIPLVYGVSEIKLRFYGPFGEERTQQQTLNVPFNFLPPKKLEYVASGGFVQDDSSTKLTRGAINYGLNKRITIGGGMEYIFSPDSSVAIPFFTTSARIGTALLFGGEYDHDVRSRVALNYRLPSNLQFSASYIRYKPGQTVINTGAIEERRATFSLPIRTKALSLYSLFSFNQTILPITSYINSEWLVSGMLFGVGANVTTYGVFIENADPFFYSNAAFAFRLPRSYVLTTQVQFDYSNKTFISFKGMVEKKLFKHIYLNGSYEKNVKSNLDNFGIQLRYELPFAQIGATAWYFNNNLTLLQSARGSAVYDPKTNYIAARDNVSVGRGSLAIIPFLDLNCNGKWDDNEYKVSGLKVKTNAGFIQPEGKDTVIRIMNIEPYVKCYIELNRFSFDNIAWQIDKKTIGVIIEPNRFISIEVPISVVAEASGYVYLIKDSTQRGQGQVYVNILKDGRLIKKILSEPDGYFSYLGLAPGTYTAEIDPEQLRKINMEASKPIEFEVLPNPEGDVIDNLEFILKHNAD